MARGMNFEFTFGGQRSDSNPTPESDDPLRILILGNFSGGSSALDKSSRVPLATRPIIRIDIDNFDKVLRRFSPRIQLGTGEANSFADMAEIQEMDDFRPERLCEKLSTLRPLVDLRKKLLNPATFDQAAAQLRQQLMAKPVAPADSVNKPSSPPTASAEDDATTLERILGQQPASRSGTTGNRPTQQSPLDIERLISQLVQPYMVPAADPNQKVYLEAANNALGDQLRAVVHDQSFQAMEATWRSLRNLISNIEDDGQIQIHLLDVTTDELAENIPADDEQLGQWGIYRRLANESAQSPDAAPWSLIIGDITISASANDLALLGALAATAQSLQTPFIAASHRSLLGCPSLTALADPTDWTALDAEIDRYWQALRKSPAADWVGLIGPRVLLRLPYGKETDEVESFEFEEFQSARQHDDFLWGNSAYLCAEIIVQAFAQDGWSMELCSQVDIDDLPAYTYCEDDEHKLQPCAEVAFGERVADAFMQRGIMPLISWRDRNAIRFVRFQSIANPPTALSGPWS